MARWGNLKTISDVLEHTRSTAGFSYSENQLQEALAVHLNVLEKTTELFRWFHVPNGGRRDIGTATNLKKQGVKPGIPDICIMFGGGIMIFIELKCATGSLRTSQKKFRDDCDRLGFPHYIIKARTPTEAVDKLHSILLHYGF